MTSLGTTSITFCLAFLLPMAVAMAAPAKPRLSGDAAGLQAVGVEEAEAEAPEVSGQRPFLNVSPGQQVAGRTLFIDGSPGRVWKGKPIDLRLKDADLREVLRSFAKLAGFNLVLDPRVEGKVTVELKGVPWDQALAVILKTHGLGAEVSGERFFAISAQPQ